IRLVNTHTREFEEFIGRNIPNYEILSHTWAEEEVSYEDYHMVGYKKIDMTCQIAAKEGISYVRVDTCCIDKRSSAELTEAINSMFRWYERSKKMIAPHEMKFFNAAWECIGSKHTLPPWGFFNINMPLLYGEEEKAFRRLQEEIIRTTPDLSLLAWKLPTPPPAHKSQGSTYRGILAEAPKYFT
ncbi:hypothetical protein EK21DRAFT_41612, partial [Setomelanomma holmii]